MRTPPNERLTSDIADTPKARNASEPDKTCPERRCILTGETQPRRSLLRLAVSPSGLVLPDAQEKAPGRGAWVCSERAAIEAAQGNGKLKAGLSRAFKTGDLEIPEELPQMVEDALTKLAQDNIVELDDERRATMVSNLMVVLCGEKDVHPVINAGSLYQ